MFTRIQKVFAFVVLVFPINSYCQNVTIHILIWTVSYGEGWIYRDLEKEHGHDAFIRRNCRFQNCFLTTNCSYFKSILDFDVVLFSSVHLSRGFGKKSFPLQRSEQQLYVFFSVEPAAYNSIISTSWEDIFNITWTYKLNSDIVNPYFFVKNTLGKFVAPKTHVRWIDVKDMAPINYTIIKKLQKKSIAAVWVASNCASKARMDFIKRLNIALSKYGHRVDIYGRCGDQEQCSRIPGDRNGVLTKCVSNIESDYYFYLAFENSFTEDYVSEKVLHGLLHFSVPIVYGGANYSRFMPPGSYLDAYKLGVEGLARKMNKIMENPYPRYYQFFKWHNYYSFYDTSADGYRDSVCAFCEFLNNRNLKYKRFFYNNISKWWNAPRPDEYPNTEHPRPIPPKWPTQEMSVQKLTNENENKSVLSHVLSHIFDFFLNDE